MNPLEPNDYYSSGVHKHLAFTQSAVTWAQVESLQKWKRGGSACQNIHTQDIENSRTTSLTQVTVNSRTRGLRHSGLITFESHQEICKSCLGKTEDANK
ncbi:unnamed protein product [Trichobilharzia regenti]|nr:unnamed protein product [Trichobilharzia regenti]